MEGTKQNHVLHLPWQGRADTCSSTSAMQGHATHAYTHIATSLQQGIGKAILFRYICAALMVHACTTPCENNALVRTT